MWRNYLKTASRIITRNFLYFIVNLAGLSLGIACCIIAYFNWEFHDDFDGGHSNVDKIFKVNTIRNFEEQKQNYGITPIPLAQLVKLESGHVENAARYSITTEVIKLEDKVIRQQVAYTDPEFLDVFSFPLIDGTPSLLQEMNQAFITEKTAIQYYGESNPLGKRLLMITNVGKERELVVAGIIEDHPLNSSFKFDMLLNFEMYADLYSIDDEDWGQFVHATFLLLDDSDAVKNVENDTQQYVELINESRNDWDTEKFYLVSLNNMANEARYIRSNYLGQNNPEGAIMIPNIMAVIILLVACFNFMNTSISLSGKRLKEIGVRKAVGAKKSQLIIQLLAENLMIIVLALGLGILLAEIMIPYYSQLGPWLDLKITYLGNITFFVFLIVLLLLTGVLSGAYPSFYISKFNTSNIFSGRFRLKGTGALSKGLMVFQLGFSLIALIQGIVYVQNTYLQSGFELGYKKHGIITIPYNDGISFDTFRDKVKQNPIISNVAGTRHHMGYTITSGIAEIGTLKSEVRVFETGDNYLETMEFDLIDGRPFLKDSEPDREGSIIVNQSFLEDYDLGEPIDHRVLLDDKAYHIIGVVKDFYPYGLWKSEDKIASVIKVIDETRFGFMVVNINGDVNIAEEYLEKEWKAMFPNVPYESEKENIHVYRSELLSGNMATLNIFLALTALFLSATGLFTLISINIQKRTKEIGLRRIMGATVSQIIRLVNKGFIWVILISIILGALMGAYLTEMFLDLMYSIHAHVGITAIGITTVLVFLIVGLTSGFKVFSAASNPPVDALKYE